MSENLMFAILGFLIACLVGTVIARFLWLRAVTVTTQAISGTHSPRSNVAIAGSSAELRSRDQEITSRDASRSQEETALRRTVEDLRTQLDDAHRDHQTASDALQSEQTERAEMSGRVALLETAIRTLTEAASLQGSWPAEQSPPHTAPLADTTPAPGEDADVPTPSEAETTMTAEQEPKAPVDNTNRDTPAADRAIDVTRSLEERIEALKKGQATH